MLLLSGDNFEFSYNEGKINGRGVYTASNGCSEERTYVDSVMHGPATLFMANGDTEERTYESGETATGRVVTQHQILLVVCYCRSASRHCHICQPHGRPRGEVLRPREARRSGKVFLQRVGFG